MDGLIRLPFDNDRPFVAQRRNMRQHQHQYIEQCSIIHHTHYSIGPQTFRRVCVLCYTLIILIRTIYEHHRQFGVAEFQRAK